MTVAVFCEALVDVVGDVFGEFGNGGRGDGGAGAGAGADIGGVGVDFPLVANIA